MTTTIKIDGEYLDFDNIDIDIVTKQSIPEPEPNPPKPEPEPNPPSGKDKYTILKNKSEVQRFLAFAGFGATKTQLDELVNTDAVDWFEQQLQADQTSFVDKLKPYMDVKSSDINSITTKRDSHVNIFIDESIKDDSLSLKNKILYALSNIIVAVEPRNNRAHIESYFIDCLAKNVFGNYKDILMDVTYCPLMAKYLTYLDGNKFDPIKGSSPDENYARELMQLFSIGLDELNLNGTKTGNETYTNKDIQELAKVFTGFRLDMSLPGIEPWINPLVIDESQHSLEPKQFLDVDIPANTNGVDSVSIAIDGIFKNKSLPAFIARRLIQKFTASHPTNDYIERVSTAFETGYFSPYDGKVLGSGERGCMIATIASIVLDFSLFVKYEGSDPHHDIDHIESQMGKIRDPLLRFIHLCRAFEFDKVNSHDENFINLKMGDDREGLGMIPFNAPSVFNFFRDDFTKIGTLSAESGMNAPEFQTVNANTVTGYINFISRYITNRSFNSSGEDHYIPNYEKELTLASNTLDLVKHLNLLLTGGSTPVKMLDQITDYVDSLPSSDDEDLITRVHLAVMLFVFSPSFMIIK